MIDGDENTSPEDETATVMAVSEQLDNSEKEWCPLCEQEHAEIEDAWLPYTEVAEKVADHLGGGSAEWRKKIDRNVRFWATPKKGDKAGVIARKQQKTGQKLWTANTREALKEALKKPIEEKGSELIPISVLERERELMERMVDEVERRAKAEETAKMQSERANELKQLLEETNARVDALVKAQQPVVPKQMLALPAGPPSQELADAQKRIDELKAELEAVKAEEEVIDLTDSKEKFSLKHALFPWTKETAPKSS